MGSAERPFVRFFGFGNLPRAGLWFVLSMTASNPNIYLVGFMGTGKTTVGRVVAQKLGFELFDSDHEIENGGQTDSRNLRAGGGTRVSSDGKRIC